MKIVNSYIEVPIRIRKMTVHSKIGFNTNSYGGYKMEDFTIELEVWGDKKILDVLDMANRSDGKGAEFKLVAMVKDE
jgi:hypothetical protein